MKFIDLARQHQRIADKVQQRVDTVLAHGQFIMGPEVGMLEAQLAKFAKVKHCITVSSGTTALQVAMMALNIGPGDEVITTPFSFFATAEVIILLGAKPVLVDIDPKTYNINAGLIEAAVTERTKAIVPVSLYGQCADMNKINAIAKRHNLAVIEDAAQSLGARYHDQMSCGLSTIACTSFFPSKPLGCHGDGGACFTNDDELAEKVRLIRGHGQAKRYHHVLIGINGRFNTLQAAMLLEKLTIFPDELERRQQVAQQYDRLLKGHFITPYIAPENYSSYAQYTIQVDNRDQLRAELSEHHIPTAVHYPMGLHQQEAIKPYMPEGARFPVAERAAERVISLPFHPYLTEQEVKQVSSYLLAAVSANSVAV